MYRRQNILQTFTIDRELMILNKMLENDEHSCSQTLTHQLWSYGSQNLQHVHKYYSERDPNTNFKEKKQESPVKSLQEYQHNTIRSKSDEPITKIRRGKVVNQRRQKNNRHQSDHYLFENIRQKQNKLQGILKETSKIGCSKGTHRSVRFSCD